MKQAGNGSAIDSRALEYAITAVAALLAADAVRADAAARSGVIMALLLGI